MKLIYIGLLLLVTKLSYSQDFTEHTIDEDFGSAIRSLRILDANNDGLEDFIALEEGRENVQPYRIHYYMNMGDASFQKTTILETDFSFRGVREIELLDVNNDGVMDIIAAFEQLQAPSNDLYTTDFTYILNNNDGTFEPYVKIDNGNIPWLRTFEVMDVDNDGFEDILYIKDFEKRLEFFPNSGNGSFLAPVTLYTNFGRGVYSADFNSDNLTDFIGELSSKNIYLNNGDSSFSEVSYPEPTTVNGFGATMITSGKIDNDDTEDLLINSVGALDEETGLLWYSNDGLGNFTFEYNFEIVANTATSSAMIADFNNDGEQDILTGIFFSGLGIPYFINQGNNDYSVQSIIDTQHDFVTATLPFDVNSDGKMDFIAGGTHGIYWYENQITLSVQDNNKIDFTVYPTISDGVYSIKYGPGVEIQKVSVYNVLGQQVYESKGLVNRLDISNQSTGIYIIEVATLKGMDTKRVVIQ